MRIKKTLAFIMAAALTVGTMTGCSQATLNYSKEIANTAKWEAATSNFEGTIDINAQGISKEIKFTSTGYKAKDQSYVDMKFIDPSGTLNIPEIKAYNDGTTAYINKGYFEGIFALTGQAVPEGVANIKEDYIGIDLASSGMNVNQIKAFSEPDGMVQFAKLVFGENNDLDLPFVQNGREYTINLDADKTVDLAGKAIKAASNNLDNINSTFNMRLPAESLAQIKTAVNDASFDTQLNNLKETLAGSTITSKEDFTDSTYNDNFNMDLKIKNFGTISLVMKAASAKSEVKTIDFPTSTLKVTQDEYIKLLISPSVSKGTNTVNTK
ncbi:hypothetical protein [Clostridium sp. BL-8]|uniref:hypothetical protein n=1 Tax=Clostridium sp. BL-8 TaxID=349938 RepID=UPI00098CE006|nr:hypothetical protein [Clostridium sp. BL-8]OOM79368.1 hypothetical protein CLOBL_16880 [Clostridium sp. BL-8]